MIELWPVWSRIQIPVEVRILSLLQNRRDGLWGGPSSLLFNGHIASFRGVRRPKREVNHSPPPTAEVMNEWNNTSTPLICPNIMDRDVINIITMIIQEMNHGVELAHTPHLHYIFPLFVACNRCCIRVNWTELSITKNIFNNKQFSFMFLL